MKGGISMYPNLLGQKAYYHLSNDEMAQIIGVSRNSFEKKMKTGRFNVKECRALCEYFNKSFCFLFATIEEIENDKKIS